jgi:hypothetical protein
VTMNLVAIAGVPVGESVTLPPGAGPSAPYENPENAKRELMWMSIAAFGLSAILGYMVSEKFI